MERFLCYFIHGVLIFTSFSSYAHLILRVSSDFNAPNKEQVFEFMDKAILNSGVNLIDTVSWENAISSSILYFFLFHDSQCSPSGSS